MNEKELIEKIKKAMDVVEEALAAVGYENGGAAWEFYGKVQVYFQMYIPNSNVPEPVIKKPEKVGKLIKAPAPVDVDEGEESVFTCDLCGKKYRRRGSFEKHVASCRKVKEIFNGSSKKNSINGDQQKYKEQLVFNHGG